MLTERRQKQAICDLMNGLNPGIDVEQMEADYQYLWQIVTGTRDSHQAYQQLIRVKAAEPDLAYIIDDILGMEAGYREEYETLADIGPLLQEVEWFWPSWIPRGLLSLLAADPGVGKTNVALDLARRTIMGMAAPDGSKLDIRSGNTIYIDAEGFLSVIYSRCRAWGMNLTKFYPVRRPNREMIDMSNKRYQDMLFDMCYDLKPDLVIVDSLSTISARGENAVEDMREILNFLADLAANFNIALVMIHHLRKQGQNANGSGITQHDLRGSGHIVMMARSLLGLYMAAPNDPNGPRKLRVLKTNLCPYPKPLLMTFTPSPNDPAVSFVDYGEIQAPEIPDNTTGECADWLLKILETGPKTYAGLVKMADKKGFSENVLQFARKTLDWQVVDTLGRQRKGNKWAIYGWQPPEKRLLYASHESHGHEIAPLSVKISPPHLMSHETHEIISRLVYTNQKLTLLQLQPEVIL